VTINAARVREILPPDFIASLPLGAIDALIAEANRSLQESRIDGFYPPTGPLSRLAYAKHMEFFKAGAIYQERCFMAANRVGKTIVGAYETSVHLTGQYPEWWEGRRFNEPVDWWAAGDTSETTRDIVQFELLGPKEDMGTGMISRKYLIGEPSARRNVADAVDTAKVQHISGGVSTLGFKSYDQGRKKFQGTKKHGIWPDEEPDAPIYDEMMLRLMTTNGLMLCTFTPLQGLTDIALRFLPDLAPVLQESGNKR
jgi:phage terminase large subunit-like protein